MKTFKGWITTSCLVSMLMVSTMTANAGVIIAGANAPAPAPCGSPKEKVDYGVIIAGITGIIIAGFTGIIIAGATTEPVEDCAIIIAG